MAEEKEVATVEIVDAPEQGAEIQPTTVDEASEAGLTQAEIDMGKESGDIVDEKPEEKKEVVEDKKDDEKKEEKPVVEDTKDTEDEIDPEKEAEQVAEYTPNEKAQYFQRKKERSKRQKADRKSELLEIKLKAEKEKVALLQSGKKVDDIDDLDADLDADLNGDKDDDVLTKGDLRKIEEKKATDGKAKREEARVLETSINERHAEAKLKDANFDNYCDLANEVMKRDEKEGGAYGMKLLQLAGNPEGNLAGYIKQLAKLHEDFGNVSEGKTVKTDDKENSGAKKIIDNASKRTTSAAVGGGNGRRIVSEDDLTVQDAATLSDDAYAKLSPATRERLLKA